MDGRRFTRGINNCFESQRKSVGTSHNIKSISATFFPSLFFLLIPSIITSACHHTRIDFTILFTFLYFSHSSFFFRGVGGYIYIVIQNMFA